MLSATNSISNSQSSTDFLSQQVLSTLAAFAKQIAYYGYTVRVYSESALSKLETLPPDRKQSIISFYENWCQWISPEGIGPTNPENSEILDKTFLKRALEYYGLEVSDEFMKTIDSETVVEIYGHDMVQLYRSLNFFNASGYSLLDLSVHEWYILWERPRMVTEKMMEYAKDVLTQAVPLTKFVTPKHVLRETYDTGQTQPFVPRAALVETLNIGSLTYKNTFNRPPGGFICTMKGSVIAVGDEAISIEFV